MTFDLVLLVSGLLAFFWLLYFAFKVWPEYVVDSCRLTLFDIRYNLFELGRTGRLDFNSDLYRSVEEDINAIIRHLERVTFSSMFAVYLAKKITGLKPRKLQDSPYDLLRAVNNQELRKEVGEIIDHAFLICMVSVVKRNIFAWTIVRVAGQLAKLKPSRKAKEHSPVFASVANSKSMKNAAWAEIQYEEGLLRGHAIAV